MFKIIKSERGVTLVELLISLFLVGVLSAAMFKIYVNQHHAWMIQDRVIEMQQNARAAIDELTRQIRMTGYELPNGLPPLEAYNTDPDTIVIHFNGNADCHAAIDKPMPQPSSELDCTDPMYDVSCFSVGQTAYIYDPFVEQGEFFEISHVQVTPGKIQHNKDPLSRCYPEEAIIMSLNRIKFYVDRSDTVHPKLMIQVGITPPQVYAEDIVDLQFQYVLKNGMVTDVPPISRDVRAVTIDIMARTPDPDIEFQSDPYRYQSFNSQVYLRNLGS